MKTKARSVKNDSKTAAPSQPKTRVQSQPKTEQGRAVALPVKTSPCIALFPEGDNGGASDEIIDLDVEEYAALKKAAGAGNILMFIANAALEKIDWPVLFPIGSLAPEKEPQPKNPRPPAGEHLSSQSKQGRAGATSLLSALESASLLLNSTLENAASLLSNPETRQKGRDLLEVDKLRIERAFNRIAYAAMQTADLDVADKIGKAQPPQPSAAPSSQPDSQASLQFWDEADGNDFGYANLSYTERSHLEAAVDASNRGLPSNRQKDLGGWAKRALLCEANRDTWKGNYPMFDLESAINNTVGFISLLAEHCLGAISREQDNTQAGPAKSLFGYKSVGIDTLTQQTSQQLLAAFQAAFEYAAGRAKGE